MALADPQEFTAGVTDYTLARTGFGEGSGVFTSEDGSATLRISHSKAKRNRTVVRVNDQKLVVDPLLPSANVPVSMSVQLVIDRPIQGYTVAEQKDLLLGLTSWLSRLSAVNAIKVLGGES